MPQKFLKDVFGWDEDGEGKVNLVSLANPGSVSGQAGNMNQKFNYQISKVQISWSRIAQAGSRNKKIKYPKCFSIRI